MNSTVPACSAPGVSVSGKIQLVNARTSAASAALKILEPDTRSAGLAASISDQHSDARTHSLRLTSTSTRIALRPNRTRAVRSFLRGRVELFPAKKGRQHREPASQE